MTATLLKHEWLRTRGLLGALVALAALATVLGTLLNASGWPVLAPLGLIVGVLAVATLAPALQLALTADYHRSAYARTGYFTHSLPMHGRHIYAAKLTWAAMVTIGALLVTAILAGIVWLGLAPAVGLERNPFAAVGELWAAISSVASPLMLTAGALTFLAMYLIWPIQYFFAVSLGAERPLNRLGLGGPVLVFVLLYVVAQLAGLAGMFVFPFGIGMVDGSLGLTSYNLIEEMRMGQAATEEVMPLGFLPALVLVTAVCLWRTVRSWDHKVSLV